MSSVSTMIAEAVAAELNAASLSKPFTAEYTLEPEFDEKADDGIKVFVVSVTEEIDLENGTRLGPDTTYNVRVAVWCKLPPDKTEKKIAANEMIQFVDEVKERLISNYKLTITESSEAALVRMNRVRYDPANYERFIFGSYLDCDYQHLV